MIKNLTNRLFSVSPQGQSVVLLPDLSSTRLGVVESVALVDTSGFLTSGSQTSSFTVLVDWVTDPVVTSISSDSLVRWINKNDFEILVSRVLVNPVRVQDSQVGGTTTNSLLSSSSQSSLVFQLVNTLVGWLTVSGTLWHRSLSVTTSNSDTVDDETLLGLVTQSSSLVWSRRSGGSVDDVLLSVFPDSNSLQESENIRLLLSLQLFQILVSTHCYDCLVDTKLKKDLQVKTTLFLSILLLYRRYLDEAANGGIAYFEKFLFKKKKVAWVVPGISHLRDHYTRTGVTLPSWILK